MELQEIEREPRRFDKLGSCSTGRGLKYEHNMCSLAFARATRLKYQFSLASNMKGCGAFDDIILQFNKPGGKKKSFFVQMKSKANMTLGFASLLSTSKSDFSLLKYFESYLEIKTNFKDKNTTPFDGEFNNILFVLYTNSDITYELKNMLSDETRRDEMVCDASDILLTNKENGGAILQLKLDGKIHDALVNALSERKFKGGVKNAKKGKKSIDEDPKEENQSVDQTEKSVDELEIKNQVEEFLRKLIIMYKQTEEECFSEVVKGELRQHLKLTDEEIILANMKFQQLFEDWWLKDYFLESNDKNDPIKEVFASQFLKHRQTDIENLNITFLDSTLNSDSEIVERNQIVLMYSPKHTTHPTLAKINQLLPRIANHAILDLKDLVEKVESIMIAFKRGVFDILVVDICEIQDRLDKVLARIQRVIKENSKKKVIFVSAYGRNMNYIKIIRTTFRDSLIFRQDTLRYSDLSFETKKLFLNKKVLFQGERLLLSQLINNTDFNILDDIDEDSVSLLLSNVVPIIGSKPEDTVDYYIDRKLEISKTMSKNIFQEIGAVFAVDSKTSEKFDLSPSILSNKTSEFVLVENSSDFEEISSRNAHWLVTDGDRLIWKQSKSGVDVIRRNLILHDVIEWKPKTALDGEDRIILLIAEPGMGKSSLLTYLAKMTKKTYPSMWVIQININSFTKILEDIKKDGFHEEKIMEILEVAAGIKDPKGKSLETGLFKNAYVYEGNIVVLIDGIDEVSPLYTQEVIKIIKFLYDTEVSKIWITSRVFLKNTLEEEFGIPSYSLVPFDKQEQELFLVKFWMSIHPDKEENVLKCLASKIRRFVASQFKDHEMDFMGIPIQSLLLAELSSSFNNPTIENINLCTLYELYVEKKWNIYLREKMNADATNVMVRYDTSSLYKKFIDNHKAAAMVAFLKVDVLDDINSSTLINKANAFIQNVQNGIEKTGIIHSVNDAGHPVFMHRTFCEYFVALWIFQNLMFNHSQNQTFINFDMHLENVQPVLKRIFDDGFKVVKSILERMLAKGFHIHSAILNNNEDDFKRALERSDLNTVDYGGRTPLHTASSCGSKKFVRILLNHGADECRLDTLLRISSVTYAIRAEHWNILSEILDRCPTSRERELNETTVGNINFMIPIIRSAKENANLELLQYLAQQKGWIMLHAGISAEHIDFTELVLSIGTAVNAPNCDGRTVLHITSENNYFSLAQLLIVKGALVNSADNSGLTPLHVAVERLAHPLIQLLLHNGADVNAKSNDGLASLHIASKTGDLESVNILLNSGADVNLVDNNGYTPLHFSAQCDHQICQILLRHGAAIDLPSGDDSCPLHIASRYVQTNVVEVLLSHKATVNVIDKNGKSPLHIACENECIELVRMLINNDASLNIKDNSECTPLMLADRKGNVSVRELLISHGAVEEKVTVVEEVERKKEDDTQSVLERETVRIVRQVHGEGERFLRRVKKFF